MGVQDKQLRVNTDKHG